MRVVKTSITCRFASRSVTAASRCILSRHGWSRSRCAGAQDSRKPWIKEVDSTTRINVTGCLKGAAKKLIKKFQYRSELV